MASQTSSVRGTQSLARAIALIKAISEGNTALSNIVEETQISKSSAHRLLQLLCLEGFISRLDGGGYSLGPRFIEYGYLARQQSHLPRVSSSVLHELNRNQKDTVHLAVRDGDEVLYLEKLPGLRGAEMRSRIGSRMPLTKTGLGRALLLDSTEAEWRAAFENEHSSASRQNAQAFVDRMNTFTQRGVTEELDDNEPGIRCVAAPIRDVTGGIVGAISLAATTPYMPEARVKALRNTLRGAAHRISKQLGYSSTTRALPDHI